MQVVPCTRVLAVFLHALKCLFVLAAIGHTCESTYEWRCSTPRNNVIYLPDIPTNTADVGLSEREPSSAGTVYVYSVPPLLDCTGNITGVEFCYMSPGATFTLLLLTSNSFRISDSVLVQTTSTDMCDHSVCCDSYSFTPRQLRQTNFSFGIVSPDNGNSLLAFHSSLPEYRVSVYQVAASTAGNLAVGSSINFGSSAPGALRIVRFIVATTEPRVGGDNVALTLVAVIVAVVFTLVLIVAGVVVLVMCLRKRNSSAEHKDVPMVDGRVDWSSTFAGIEQPNEAYSVVLNNNVTYDEIKEPLGQRTKQSQAQSPLGAERANQDGVYENTILAEDTHVYEEVLPLKGLDNAYCEVN